MPETIAIFLGKAHEAAALLDDRDLASLVQAVADQASAPKLNILVVGTSGAGRCSTVNALLGQPDLLPISPIPKAPLSLHIAYGEIPSAAAHSVDGSTIPIRLQDLRSLLIGGETDAKRYKQLNVNTNSPLLANMELCIESLGAQRSEDEWLALLAAADYTIMVLNATALLSQQERWFLSELLHGHYGLQRVALVINQMDLIPEEERASISDLVRAFLGPLHNQPAMVEFSAARARAGLASGEMPADCGFEELSYLVAGDLIASTLALRTTAAVRGAGLILAALSEAVARQQALLSLDQEHLQERLSLLDVNSQRMQALIARAQSRLTLFVATLLKEQMLREIEAFGRTLKEQLPAEIMAIEDIARIKRHLPGYLEKLWMAFFDRQLPMARARLAEEVQHIHEIIAEDLQEILGVDTPSLTPLLAEFDPRPARALAVLAPKRGKQAAPLAASVLQTGGLVIWLTGGGLLGIAALGIGQIVRMVSKKSVAESNRQALIASAIESLPELERRIQDQVEAGYTQLVEELQGAVTELYAGRIAEMRTLLEKSAQQRQTLDARRDQLESLVRVTVPELRELLSHLSPEEVGV